METIGLQESRAGFTRQNPHRSPTNPQVPGLQQQAGARELRAYCIDYIETGRQQCHTRAPGRLNQRIVHPLAALAG